jgi:hypothetical protein
MAEQKKKVVRKKKTTAAAQSAAQEEKSEKYLTNVPEEFCFLCHDGQVFRNIHELIDGFDRMSDDIFAYHCNENKNDFWRWVVDVIQDEKLAEDLKNAKSRQEAKDIFRIRYYDVTDLEV